MDKSKIFLALIGVGIGIGVVLTVFVVGILGARPSGINLGPVEFDFQATATIATNPIVPPPTIAQYQESANTPPVTAIPQVQATNTQPVLQPTITQAAAQSSILIHNEPVSPETLARIVGGDAAYWKQAGSVVWVYSNKDHNTLMRHPGENMILTYWAGFGDPQNTDGCQIIISPANSLEKYIKCTLGTNAQIVADQVGLHLIDYTGYFP
jgi:hypothetical protein